jgi:mannitol-specific phosphotransferase system IIBC component
MKWIEDNPVLFAVIVIALAGLALAMIGVTEAGLASLTGAFGVMSDRLSNKKGKTKKAKEQIKEERKKTDKILEELEHEVEKKANLSGDDVAYALNDVLARIRSSKK